MSEKFKQKSKSSDELSPNEREKISQEIGEAVSSSEIVFLDEGKAKKFLEDAKEYLIHQGIDHDDAVKLTEHFPAHVFVRSDGSVEVPFEVEDDLYGIELPRDQAVWQFKH